MIFDYIMSNPTILLYWFGGYAVCFLLMLVRCLTEPKKKNRYLSYSSGVGTLLWGLIIWPVLSVCIIINILVNIGICLQNLEIDGRVMMDFRKEKDRTRGIRL